VLNNLKILFIFWGFFLITLSINAQYYNRTYILSISPSYESVFSQVEIRAQGLKVGFGTFNHFRFYFFGSLQYSHGKNLADNYKRTSIFNRISPAVNMKWHLLGKNKYKSTEWFYNIRLCFDASLTGHISYSELLFDNKTVKQKLIFYPSTDFGLSLLIPFGYIAKHKSPFLNRSDLFIEVSESLLIKNDVSLIVSTASKIDDITLSSKLSINWIYLF